MTEEDPDLLAGDNLDKLRGRGRYSAMSERFRLTELLETAKYQNDLLAQKCRELEKERDEARRSCCEYAAIVNGADTADGMESGRFYEIAMKYMKDRGWDCFKEATDGK